jgi:hypothetical protein
VKTKHFIKSVSHSLNFIDVFGDNLGGSVLKNHVSLSGDKNTVTITNAFGTVKTFEKGQINAICDELANCLEGFRPLYPGYVRVHSGKLGNKVVVTLMTKIFLDGARSARTKTATISISGKDIEVLFEVSETFTEIIS